MLVYIDVREQQGMDFTGGSMIMKGLKYMQLFTQKTLTDRSYVNYMWIIYFLSAVWTLIPMAAIH